MFSPSRDEARRFFTDAWARYRASAPLSGLQQLAAGIIAQHPEYHAVLEDPEGHVARDYLPEAGDVNPFLHLSLHLAIAEQLSIDQPPGIRAHVERLTASRSDAHEALHAALDCLGEVIWHAQREAKAPDAAMYLACLERQR